MRVGTGEIALDEQGQAAAVELCSRVVTATI